MHRIIKKYTKVEMLCIVLLSKILLNTFINCINYKNLKKQVSAMTENSAGLQILGVNKHSRDGMEVVNSRNGIAVANGRNGMAVANGRIGMAVVNNRDGMAVVNNKDGMVVEEVVLETALSSGAMTAATAITTTTTIRNQFSADNSIQMRSS